MKKRLPIYLPDWLWPKVCWIIVKIVYRFSTEDLPEIPKGEAAILTCNHVSFIDWLLISGSFDRPVRFVMDHKLYYKPIFRYFVETNRSIPVAAKNVNFKIYTEAFISIKEYLDNKEIVCIFPEGTITRNGQLGEFKPGVEKALKASPVSVYPLVLQDVYGSFFSRVAGRALSQPSLIFKNFRKKIVLKGLGKLRPEEATAETLEALTRKHL